MKLEPDGIEIAGDSTRFAAHRLQLRLHTDRGTADVTYDKTDQQPDAQTGSTSVLQTLLVRTELRRLPGIDAATVFHTLENTSDAPVWIHNATTGQFAQGAGVTARDTHGLGWDLRYAHTDNLRTEKYPHCQMEYPYLRMLPTGPITLGAGEDQPFPALYLHDQRSGSGMVIAAASQELNYTVFGMQKAARIKDSLFDQFELRHDFAQAGGLQISPGQSVTLDGLFFQLIEAADLNKLYVDYLDHIASTHTFRGSTTPLRTEAMHCTWNYGVFADQRQEPLLKTARFIAQNLPGIRFFLMDAGYLHGDVMTTYLDRFYPDPNAHVSPESFPNGIRGFSDELRRLGLRPGIWWSPTVQVDTDLYRDHPDWFLRRDDGGLYLIGQKNGFLDYSHPEALEHLDRTLAVLLGQWGMDACKMDFWSQNFEARNVRLHDPTMTAIQVRTRFFDTVRKHLPDDGLFMTCVAVGMGNPFIGQHADTYRNTIDIGTGDWHEQIYNCAWALPTLLNDGRKTLLLDNDSVGANLDAPDNENFFRFTWSFIHQGMIETGGRMEQWPAKYVEAMRRCTEHMDRGHAVRCADPQAFTGAPFPKVLVTEYPQDSVTWGRGVRAHIGLFNWGDQAQVIGASHQQLALPGLTGARDFWTDEQVDFVEDGIYTFLQPRSARLYEVAR